MKKLLLALFLLPCLLQAQNTSTIYGLARDFNPAQIFLARMQPGTGVVTEISPASISQGYALNPLSAIDPVNGKFYYGIGPGVLLSVDLVTGLADSLVLNIPFPSYFDLMQYNCADSTLYGLYRTSAPAECYLAKIDVNTGTLTTISPSSVAAGYVLNAKSTLDPVNNIFYFSPATNILMGLDLVTGLPVTQSTISFSGPGQFFDMMTYNCDNGIIYGVNRTSSPAALYPATINPTTGLVTNLSNTSMGQAILVNAMSEINPFSDLFHFFNGAFVTFDLVTGNVLPTPPLSFSPVPGNIYFDMIARDNCKCVLSNPNVGINEITAQQLQVFPNPTETGGLLTLRFKEAQQDRTLLIFNMQGQLITQQEVSAGSVFSLISTANFAPGCYYASMEKGSPVKFIVH